MIFRQRLSSERWCSSARRELADEKDIASRYTFDWYGSGSGAAVQKRIEHDRDYANTDSGTGMEQGAWLAGFDVDHYTSYTYNGHGQLASAYVSDGMARTVRFTSDAAGQVIRREETRPANAPTQQTGSPHEVWYRFAGREFGYAGNNGSDAVSAAAAIDERRAHTSVTGTFRGGSPYADLTSDLGYSYDPLSSYNQGSAAGGYTARGGESLAQVAQALWGDAGLWYKLAEANGLSATSTLAAGQSLTIPAGVARNTHNAGTFKPYDPAQTIGDLSPTLPKPRKDNDCGIVGQVLAAVVAVAATTLLGAIPGNLISQGFNNLIGLQDGFSWKSLGMSVVSAVVTQGVGQVLGQGAMLGSQFVGNVVRGATSSAITQGIGVATRMQDNFNWAGVAAAGIGQGVSAGVGGMLAPRMGNGFGTHLVAQTAGGLANAATRSAINGESFGRNVVAAIPDIIGQAVGATIGGTRTLSDRGAGPENLLAGTPYADDPAKVGDIAASWSDPVIQQPEEQMASDPVANNSGVDTQGEAIMAAEKVRSLLAAEQGSGKLVAAASNGSEASAFKDYVFGGTPSNVGHISGLISAITGDGARAVAGFMHHNGGLDPLVNAAYEAFAQDPYALESFADYIEIYAISDVADYQAASDAYVADLRALAASIPRNEIVVTARTPSRDFTWNDMWAAQARMDADPTVFKAPIGEPGERASRLAVSVMAMAENAPQVKAGLQAKYDRLAHDGLNLDEKMMLSVGILAAVAPKGRGRKSSVAAEGTPEAALSRADLARMGRSERQTRLRELAKDPKVSSVDRGWIQQEINSIARGQRSNIRVPPGKVLAHRRGFEAKLGYSYKYSDLQSVDLHKLQHKHEGY